MKRALRRLLARLIFHKTSVCPICHRPFYGRPKHFSHVQIAGRNYRYACRRCRRPQIPGPTK
jgi:hypothetical protein